MEDHETFDYAAEDELEPVFSEQFDTDHADLVRGRRRRRKHLRRLLTVLLVLVFVWWFNNYTLRTVQVEVASGKIRSPMRLCIIADQHATKHGISNRRIVRRIEKADPDLVIVLGDMYTRDSEWDRIQIPINLTEDIISAGYPVYYVTGEHDTDSEYKAQLTEIGAHLMNYQEETVEISGNRLHIMGIDNVHYTDTFDLANEFTLRDDCFNIVLAHIPNYSAFARFGAELTLCADTHGGMVQLPFGKGPLIDPDSSTLLPEWNGEKVFDKGFFDYDGGTMFITSGIGVSPAPVRFNNRPEVVVMDLVPEQNGG
ncbi:MAG: metallophosphoesterase family protein [Ruminococcus sp.]|nr:metallophosphoesterase family protein [Ruminococcus sp.]